MASQGPKCQVRDNYIDSEIFGEGCGENIVFPDTIFWKSKILGRGYSFFDFSGGGYPNCLFPLGSPGNIRDFQYIKFHTFTLLQLLE
jgi:hypothetical protein